MEESMGIFGEAMDHRRNPFAPEPLSFSNFSGDTGDSDEPGTFAFKDLQNIQDISAPTPTLKAETSAGTTHAAYENALLEYSGLNEQACESFQFNLTPGNSPMKFKQDSELYSHQQPRIVVPQLSHHAGATATAPRIPNGANGQQVVGSALTKEEEFSDDDLGVNPAAAGLTGMPVPSRGTEADEKANPEDHTTSRTYTLDREQSLMLLNKPGGVATEEELNEIDPSLLTPEETKKLKRMRRAIRNRESATASRMRRKEYIESLEKRTSELCSENAMLDLSVTEMKMREKGKAADLDRVRAENNQLRAESYANRAENHQLRQDKQMIEERLKNVQLVNDEEKDVVFSGPGTWPVPKSRPQRVIIEETANTDSMDLHD